jgi:hypothetical protein
VPATVIRLGEPKHSEMLPVANKGPLRASSGRQTNESYRVREHLTEAEVAKLLAALKRNRHGHRDWLLGLIIYRAMVYGSRRLATFVGMISTYPSALLSFAD